MRALIPGLLALAACAPSPRLAPPADPAAATARADAPTAAEPPAAPLADAPPAPVEIVPPDGLPPIDGARRLGRNAMPVRYDLELYVDPAADHVTGSVAITLEVAEPARTIDLHADGIAIDETTLAAVHAIPVMTQTGAHGGLRVIAAGDIPAGRARLSFGFRSKVGTTAGGHRRREEGSDACAVAQFGPAHARAAFPCFDEPGFAAPLFLSLTAPHALTAVANAPESARAASRDLTTTSVRFEPSAPLPASGYAWAVGPWDVTEAPKGAASTRIRVIAPKGQGQRAARALAAAPKLLAALEEWCGTPYPFAKLDLIASSGPASRAGGTAGLVAVPEGLLLPGDADLGARDRAEAMDALARGLAAQWFGGLVTPAGPDDAWLGDALAAWIGTKCVQTVAPELDAELASMASMASLADAIRLDARDGAIPLRRPDAETGDVPVSHEDIALSHAKGAHLVAMTEDWLGPDVFREGVRAFLAAHRYAPAGTADLLAALETASGESVGEVLSGFLDRPGVPRIDWDWERHGTRVTVRLRQSRWSFGGDPAAAVMPEPAWRVPVTVTCRARPRAATVRADVLRKTVLVGAGGATVEFEDDALRDDGGAPIVVAGGSAYCVAVPPEGTALQLARRLGGATSPERVRLASELPLLRDAGLVSGSDATAALLALADGGDRHAVSAACAACVEIAELATDDVTAPLLRDVVHSALVPSLVSIGLVPKKDETAAEEWKREDLARAIGAIGADDRVVASCRASAIRFFRDPASEPQSVLRFALPVAARRGDADLWEKLRASLAKPLSPPLRSVVLDALRSFGDPALVGRSWDFLLDGTCGAGDVERLLSPAEGMPEPEPVARARWEWIERRFAALRERYGDEAAAALPRAAGALRAASDRERVAAFLASLADPPAGMERSVAHALASIRENEMRAELLRVTLVEILSRR